MVSHFDHAYSERVLLSNTGWKLVDQDSAWDWVPLNSVVAEDEINR